LFEKHHTSLRKVRARTFSVLVRHYDMNTNMLIYFSILTGYVWFLNVSINTDRFVANTPNTVKSTFLNTWNYNMVICLNMYRGIFPYRCSSYPFYFYHWNVQSNYMIDSALMYDRINSGPSFYIFAVRIMLKKKLDCYTCTWKMHPLCTWFFKNERQTHLNFNITDLNNPEIGFNGLSFYYEVALAIWNDITQVKTLDPRAPNFYRLQHAFYRPHVGSTSCLNPLQVICHDRDGCTVFDIQKYRYKICIYYNKKIVLFSFSGFPAMWVSAEIRQLTHWPNRPQT
jgi:hypothetical protein